MEGLSIKAKPVADKDISIQIYHNNMHLAKYKFIADDIASVDIANIATTMFKNLGDVSVT